MLKRIVKTGLTVAVVLILVGGIFHALGLRVLLDGGGTPYLRFVPSELAQAERIARHREMQRQAAEAAAPAIEMESRAGSLSEKGLEGAEVPVATADLPAQADVAAAASEYWTDFRGPNRDGHYDGFIFGLDESILACIDAATGELQWKGGRYGYGQVMLADGHLIVLTEDGSLVLVKATPEGHVELVRFPVLEGKTWNHPAISDGILLVRNLAEMAAFDLRLGPNANARKGS